MITDGFHAGLEAAVWTLGALLGVATALGPWTLGAWLIYHTVHRITQTRAAWWLRAQRAARRLRSQP